jgi:hypothetical protein
VLMASVDFTAGASVVGCMFSIVRCICTVNAREGKRTVVINVDIGRRKHLYIFGEIAMVALEEKGFASEPLFIL